MLAKFQRYAGEFFSLRGLHCFCACLKTFAPYDAPTSMAEGNNQNDKVDSLTIALSFDRAINYAFQQNAIPVVKELRIRNDAKPRKALTIRVATEPSFAAPVELRLQSLEADGEYRVAPLDLKLSPDFLAGLNEKLSGLLRVEVIESGEDGQTPVVLQSTTESISLLARAMSGADWSRFPKF